MKARSEIRTWMRKSNFDPYFCAGEVMAWFCEVVRWIEENISTMEVHELPSAATLITEFYAEIIYDTIDGSDGIHVFGDAYLEHLFATFRHRWHLADGDILRLRNIINQ
jgi:hypothetical protein